VIDPESPTDDAPLADCRERGVGLVLSDPISDRVDHLVDCVEATGERTSRKEVIASLILDAPPDGAELAARIRRLRLATIGDAVAQPSRRRTSSSSVARHPGPRRRRSMDSSNREAAQRPPAP
jgi:hypothetical protein